MNIVLWTLPGDLNSEKAEFGLKIRKLDYTEKRVGVNATMEEFVSEFPNTSTFPQVIIDNTHLGSHLELETYLVAINQWKPTENGQ